MVLRAATAWFKDVREKPLAEGGAQASGGVAGDALALVDSLPAEGSELLKKGLFDFGIFGHIR